MGDARRHAVLVRGQALLGRRLAGPAQAGAGRRRADRHRRRRSQAHAGAGRPLRREYNLPFAPVERFVEQCKLVAAACQAVDRDPTSITYTSAAVACIGADDAEVAQRAAAIGREPDELRKNGVAGTPDEARATLQRWEDAGAERVYLQVLDLSDLDHLDAIAALVS